MISKSFLKSSIIYTVSGALPMIGSLILLPFYANRLNALHYAQVQFYISVALLLQILFSYSVESYFGIKYTQLSDDPGQQRKFTGTVSALLLLIGAALLLLFGLSGNYLFELVFDPEFQMEFWPYGFYAVLTAFFNSYFKAATNALIYFKRPYFYFAVNALNFIATIGISIGGLLLFPDTIIGPVYGRLLSGIIIFFLALHIFGSHGRFSLEKGFIREIQAFCTPYFFYVISMWVLGQFDRYILQTHVTKAELNTYDLVLKCFFGIEFLQNTLSAIIFPKIYEIWNKQGELVTSKESNRYFNVFTAINIVQLILFCIFLPLLYWLLIKNESFYESQKYIGMLAVGYSLRTVLAFYLSTILFAKKTKALLKIFGVSAIVQIFLTIEAIKWWGLEGAIYAGLFTKVLQVLLCTLFTRGIFRYNYNYLKILGIPLLYILVNIIQYHVSPDYRLWHYIAQLLFFSLIFYAIFKNEILQLLRQFKGPAKA